MTFDLPNLLNFIRTASDDASEGALGDTARHCRGQNDPDRHRGGAGALFLWKQIGVYRVFWEMPRQTRVDAPGALHHIVIRETTLDPRGTRIIIDQAGLFWHTWSQF